MNKHAKSNDGQRIKIENQHLPKDILKVYSNSDEHVDSQQDQGATARSKTDATTVGGMVRGGDNEHFPPGASGEAAGKADGPTARPVVREGRAGRDDRCVRRHAQGNARNEAETAMSDRLLSLPQTADVLNISARTVWRLVAAGQIPAPVRIGRACRWCCSDISGYIEKLKLQRDGVSV